MKCWLIMTNFEMNDFGIDSHEQQPSILRMASNSLNGAICNVRIFGRNIKS